MPSPGSYTPFWRPHFKLKSRPARVRSWACDLRYKIGNSNHAVRDALKEPGDDYCGAAKTQNHHQISDRFSFGRGKMSTLKEFQSKNKQNYLKIMKKKIP